MEHNKKGNEHYLECSFVSISVLSFANGTIRVSLRLSLLHSKFAFIHALILLLESWGPLRKQKLSVK